MRNETDILDKLLPLSNPAAKLLGIIFSGLGLLLFGIPLSLYIAFDNDPANFFSTDPPEVVLEWLPYFIPGLMGFVFLIVGLIMLRVNKRNVTRFKNLWRSGIKAEATVVSNIQNFHYRINDVPQRIVVFQTSAGKQFEFKFFSEILAQHLPMGTKLDIRYNRKGKAIPDVEFFKGLVQN